MANFDSIVQWLLYQEDDRRVPGKIVNLNDGAGFTRLGITSNNFGQFVPADFFSSMPFADAVKVSKQVYRDHFWALFSGDKIVSDIVAAPVLSASVNISGGVSRAVKIVQEILGIVEDGILGPKTLAELNSKDPVIVARLFRSGWENFYRHLAQVNPSKTRFLDGWLARADFPYPSPLVPSIYA